MRVMSVFSSLISAMCVVSTASAETYTIKQPVDNTLATYCQQYVPETVLINTRGILVHPGSVSWTVVGNQWTKVYNPPVYIQTARVLERDHYTLVPGPCH